MTELGWVDGLVGLVLAVGLVRGLRAGVVREGLALSTLAACTIMVRLFAVPLAARFEAWTGGELSGRTAVALAGLLVLGGTFLACRSLSRRVQRGVPSDVSLRFGDRLGGGILGLAEGGLVATIGVLVALAALGAKHPSVVDTRSLALVEAVRAGLPEQERTLPAVAAPRRDWLQDRR